MIAPQYCKVGQTMTFEGYADDFGNHIVAVEFSLDDGASWASFDTSASDPGKSVHWTYAYTPQAPGTYQLFVRSVTEDGRRSPMAASAILYVEDAQA